MGTAHGQVFLISSIVWSHRFRPSPSWLVVTAVGRNCYRLWNCGHFVQGGGGGGGERQLNHNWVFVQKAKNYFQGKEDMETIEMLTIYSLKNNASINTFWASPY